MPFVTVPRGKKRLDTDHLWELSIAAQVWGTFFVGIKIPRWDARDWEERHEAVEPAKGKNRKQADADHGDAILAVEQEWLDTFCRDPRPPPIHHRSSPEFIEIASRYLDYMLDADAAEENAKVRDFLDQISAAKKSAKRSQDETRRGESSSTLKKAAKSPGARAPRAVREQTPLDITAQFECEEEWSEHDDLEAEMEEALREDEQEDVPQAGPDSSKRNRVSQRLANLEDFDKDQW